MTEDSVTIAEAVQGATLIAMNCPRRKTCGEVFGVFYPPEQYKRLRVVHISRHEHHAYIKPEGDEITLWRWNDEGRLTAGFIADNCIISVVPVKAQGGVVSSHKPRMTCYGQTRHGAHDWVNAGFAKLWCPGTDGSNPQIPPDLKKELRAKSKEAE